MWITLLLASTLAWFLLPLAPALREWRHKADADPLRILPRHAGDVKYFANRFRELIAEEQERCRGDSAAGAQGLRQWLRVGSGEALSAERRELRLRRLRRRVFAEAALALPGNFTFEREVYGCQDIYTGPNSRFRAILAEGALEFGEGCAVLRWAHAERIEAGSDCSLQGRLSAVSEVALQSGCRFQRISAKTVRFGTESGVPAAPPAVAVRASLPVETADGRLRLGGDFELPAQGLLQADVIAQGRVLIGPGAMISGSLKGEGEIWLAEGATVTGAVICGGRLRVGANCRIEGPVVAEDEVLLGGGAVIGSPDRLCTVTAPVIRVEEGARVHGTVWARQAGWVQPSGAEPG